MSITVYSRANCPQCDMTKNFLKSKGLSFNEIDVRAPGNEAHRDFVLQHGFRSMPVVDAGNGNIWAAHDRARLESLVGQGSVEEMDLLAL